VIVELMGAEKKKGKKGGFLVFLGGKERRYPMPVRNAKDRRKKKLQGGKGKEHGQIERGEEAIMGAGRKLRSDRFYRREKLAKFKKNKDPPFRERTTALPRKSHESLGGGGGMVGCGGLEGGFFVGVSRRGEG